MVCLAICSCSFVFGVLVLNVFNETLFRQLYHAICKDISGSICQ